MKQSLPYSSNKSNKNNTSIKECNSSIIDLKVINNDKNISYKKLIIKVLNRVAILLPILVILFSFSIYFTYNFIYFFEIINLKQNNVLNDNSNRNSINSGSTICSSLITCINMFLINNYLNDISINTNKPNDVKNTLTHSNTINVSSSNNQFNFDYYYNIIINNKSFITELSFITFTFIIMVISFFRAWLSNPGFVIPGKNSIRIEYDNDSGTTNTSNSISSKKTETIAEQVIYYEDKLNKQYNILISNSFINEYKKIKKAIKKANNSDFRNNIDEENLSLLQSNNISVNYNSSTDSNNNDIGKRKEYVNKEKQNLISEIKRLITSSDSSKTKIDLLILNEKDKQTNDIRLCLKCDIIKPDRSHHCLNCKSCVLTCDHHCPWVNNCIGYNNYKFFYCLIVYSMITSVSFAFRFNSFMVFWINMKETVNISFLCFIVFYIIMIVISVCLFLFNTYHLMLICNNMTTYEYSIYSKTENDYKYLLNNQYHKYFINSFDNIKNVLGSNILIWVLPINKSIIRNNFTEVLKDNSFGNTRNSGCDSNDDNKLTKEDFAYIYEAIHDNENSFLENEAMYKELFSNGVNHKIRERHLLEKKKSM